MLNKSIFHLKRIPLFSSVPEKELEIINLKLQDVSYGKGQTIINEGETGDCLYLIRNGKVKVIGMPDNVEIILSYLREGDYFGEMALITGDSRSATVVADSDVDLWRLSKLDFDVLILSHPSITLSLTHMLSQRLNLSNKARESTEISLKSQICPSGNLDEISVIHLMKFAEDNSLTGKIILRKDDRKAYFHFEKGQLGKLDFENKDEDQAMDELQAWDKGTFQIEPSVFQVDELLTTSQRENILDNTKTRATIERFLTEKLSEFIQFAGSRTTQAAINKAFYKFEKYFNVSGQFNIKTMPELHVGLQADQKLTEKHYLFLAVFMRDVVHSLDREVIGMDFWLNKSHFPELNVELEKLNYFEYFAQAADFICE
jgi:CRP-like cAMP-binding protein